MAGPGLSLWEIELAKMLIFSTTGKRPVFGCIAIADIHASRSIGEFGLFRPLRRVKHEWPLSGNVQQKTVDFGWITQLQITHEVYIETL